MSFEDVIGNVEIKDNVIITPDKRYVTIVEIAPINFDYKTALDKEKIIEGFAQLTKIGPVTMQIKSLSRRADVNKYINVLNHDFALEKDSHLKPYQDDYMRLIKRLGVYSGLSRRFFIVLEACGNDTEKIKSFDDAVYYLDKAKQKIRRFIRNCGNETCNCDACVKNGEVMEHCVQGSCSNFKSVEQVKAEAYKEFAEKLKKELSFGHYIQPDQIDNLFKEMEGED